MLRPFVRFRVIETAEVVCFGVEIVTISSEFSILPSGGKTQVAMGLSWIERLSDVVATGILIGLYYFSLFLLLEVNHG
jgi:hypothetical protein